ncbi:hypothetical protein DL765_000225 [Monosporascus sp. GIB2]|nr:hypothetical protein DL765_000225 [Monosporascus sp. GIB2]
MLGRLPIRRLPMSDQFYPDPGCPIRVIAGAHARHALVAGPGSPCTKIMATESVNEPTRHAALPYATYKASYHLLKGTDTNIVNLLRAPTHFLTACSPGP